jgi:hypothetical protein
MTANEMSQLNIKILVPVATPGWHIVLFLTQSRKMMAWW